MLNKGDPVSQHVISSQSHVDDRVYSKLLGNCSTATNDTAEPFRGTCSTFIGPADHTLSVACFLNLDTCHE